MPEMPPVEPFIVRNGVLATTVIDSQIFLWETPDDVRAILTATRSPNAARVAPPVSAPSSTRDSTVMGGPSTGNSQSTVETTVTSNGRKVKKERKKARRAKTGAEIMARNAHQSAIVHTVASVLMFLATLIVWVSRCLVGLSSTPLT